MAKEPIDADYSGLLKKIRQILKLLDFKLVVESGLLSIRIMFAKITLKKGQDKYFFIDSSLKTNPWMYKINGLNGEKIIESFYKK